MGERSPVPDLVVTLRVSDLREIIASEVRAALSERPAANDAPWMTADDVAALLGYKRRSIPGLVRTRGLPCHRVGRLLRFRRDEVEAWARGGV